MGRWHVGISKRLPGRRSGAESTCSAFYEPPRVQSGRIRASLVSRDPVLREALVADERIRAARSRAFDTGYVVLVVFLATAHAFWEMQKLPVNLLISTAELLAVAVPIAAFPVLNRLAPGDEAEDLA